MAIEILTLDSEHEFQETEFQLDGETFRLLARYIARTDSWMLSLFDTAGDPIATGRRLTVGNFLVPWLTGRNRPAGQLIALDTTNRDEDPGEHDLGERVLVIYADAETMIAMGAQSG